MDRFAMTAWMGVPADRVVAVVAVLADRRVQWGSGFLVSDGRVLTAWHCTIDKESRVAPVSLSVIRKTDGAEVAVDRVLGSPGLDVAVLDLGERPWAGRWQPLKYGRVDRSHSGELEKCQAIGYPLFQLDPADGQRNTAEVHGSIRRTDEDESGFLLMRDAELTTVTVPDSVPDIQQAAGSQWGGLSGALVFHQGYALGVVVEHHPRQGATAVRILPVDRIAASEEPDVRAIADVLGLPSLAGLRLLTGEPLDPMAERLAEGTSSGPVDVLAGERGAPGWSVVTRFLNIMLRGPGGALPFAGRDAELGALDRWIGDPAGPSYHLVSGNAGAGKSTLLARWSASLIERSSGPRVVFVPITARYEASAGLDVFRALCYRLASVHGVPYNRTGDFKDYREAVSALLTLPAPDGSTLLVVVDSLDEASDWEAGAQYFPRQLGARVRVLLSARHTGQQPTPQAWRDLLELEATDCATTELSALTPAALVRLVEQVRGTAASGNGEIAQQLHHLTGGEPVVTALYLRDLAEHRGADAGTWPGESSSVEKGINGYLERWLKEQRRLWDARDAKRVKRALRVLNLLSLAEGPIEHAYLRQVARRSGLDMDGEQERRALGLLDRFVLPGAEHASVVLAHPLIGHARREWLRQTGEYEQYARAYADWADEVLGNLLKGSVTPGEVPRYLTRHMSEHLLSAVSPGDVKAAERMAAAYRLTDRKWRQVQEQASDDLLGYRRDVTRFATHARSADAAAATRGQQLPYLPERISCAAVLAVEKVAFFNDMTPQLASQLVRYGLWRPSRAMNYLAGLWARSANIVTAIAPYLDREDLPALRQVLGGFSGPGSDKAAWEEIAWATAAYARRVLELSGPEASLAAATWVPPDNQDRDKVAVWVLGELIPHLPAQLARQALAEALRIVHRNPRDLVASVAHLTRHVPLDLANTLWEPEELGAEPSSGPVQVLIDGYRIGRDHDPRSPFMLGWPTDLGFFTWKGREFVATAPWLDEPTFTYTLTAVLAAMSVPNQGPSFMEAVLPWSPYEGLMSVVPAGLAEEVAPLLTDRLDHKDLTICLLQLLPLLSGGARERFAAEAFRDPAELDLGIGTVEVVGPAVGETGYAEQVLAAAESRLIEDPRDWLRMLAPYLTREQAQRQLMLLHPIALARLASFGPTDAANVLDRAYKSAEWLPDPLVSRMTTRFTNSTHQEHPEPDPGARWGTTRWGTPWWEEGTYLGVPCRRASGLRTYLRPSRDRGSLRALLPTGSQHDEDHRQAGMALTDCEAVALAFEAAGGITTDDLPILRAIAASREDQWAGPTVLGAGTHLRDPRLRDEVTAELASILESMREAARTGGPTARRMDGLPDHCPWLMLGAGNWTPFFVRMLHQAVWPYIKPLLFGDGYLNGVERTHSWYMEQEEHQRLDDWAHDILAYTTILDIPELNLVASVGDPEIERQVTSGQAADRHRIRVESETTRGWFRAGLAIGYATRGDWNAAASNLSKIGGENEHLAVEAALTEMGAVATPAELPQWLTQVDKHMRHWNDRRELLQRVLNNRWPELSDEQCSIIIDQWLTAGIHRSPMDVLSDAVAYADAIQRLAGEAELHRILTLAESRRC